MILAVIVLSGCKKEPGITVDEYSRSDFPEVAGSYWKYKVHDYVHDVDYTVIHKIDWSEKINADTTILHFTLYNDNYTVRDSAIGILTTNDFTYLGVKQEGISLFGDFCIKFPFRLGSSWINTSPVDTFTVMWHATTCSFKQAQYENVFYMFNYYSRGLNKSKNEVFVSKDIGIVEKSYFLENGDDAYDRKQSYSLIDYHLE